MNENEKPAIGSSEAAVLTVVELIARAAQMSEQHMAYWLDLYYQVRSWHEAQIRRMTMDDIFGWPPEARAETSPAPTERADPAGESAAGSKKKQRLTGADLRAIQKKSKSDGAGYQWREYKRSVLQRLSDARARGATTAAIAEASGGKLTENTVMDFLEAVFRPIEDYRALESALDRLAEK